MLVPDEMSTPPEPTAAADDDAGHRPGRRRLPTLAEVYSSRANGIGWLRFVLAFSVLVGHSWVLGYAGPNLGAELTHEQTDVGALAVFGFFVLSGFLISASGLKFSLSRFAWHRFLRIFPSFWVCLIVIAFVLAPLVALYENGSLAGYWGEPGGPWGYLVNNFFTGMQQTTISGLLADTPYGAGSPEGGCGGRSTC